MESAPSPSYRIDSTRQSIDNLFSNLSEDIRLDGQPHADGLELKKGKTEFDNLYLVATGKKDAAKIKELKALRNEIKLQSGLVHFLEALNDTSYEGVNQLFESQIDLKRLNDRYARLEKNFIDGLKEISAKKICNDLSKNHGKNFDVVNFKFKSKIMKFLKLFFLNIR